MCNKIFLSLMLLLGACGQLVAQDARQILERARHGVILQQNDLKGHINKNGRQSEVRLFLRGENIQFQVFDGRAWDRFHMRLKGEGYDLFSVGANGKAARFPEARISQPILGTDLTYEDLAFRFLYWPNPKLEGEERLGMDKALRPAWRIRVVNPDRGKGLGQYAIVNVWIDQKTGALVKVIGYNAQGRPLKQFQVSKIMRLPNKTYTLETMKVESIDPATNRTRGVTFLQFDQPKAAAPRPLR